MLIPLLFFGAGVLFASLIWGKYKQRSIALRERIDRHVENEDALQESLESERAAHADLKTTCRTLEEEFANIATEREALLAESEKAAVERAHFEKVEADFASLSRSLVAQRERFEALLVEIDQLRQHAERSSEKVTVAENRARQLADEKEDVLSLVDKLQEKLEQFDTVRDQLCQENETISALHRRSRYERLRRRRLLRQAEAEPNIRPRKRGISKRPSATLTHLPIPRQAPEPEPVPTPETPKPAASSATAPPLEPAPQKNGQQPAGLARRVLSAAAGHFFSGSSGERRTKKESEKPAPEQETRKRRLRW